MEKHQSLVENDDTLKVSNMLDEQGNISNGLFEIERVQEHIKNISTVIDEHVADISSITYRDYMENFLKLHMGLIKEDQKYLMDTWIEFSGGIYKPVNLVDNDGTFITQIPPVMPKDAYELMGDGLSYDEVYSTGASIGARMTDIEMKKNNYIPAAQAASKALFDDLTENFNTDKINELKEKWRQFFIKIGVIKAETPNYTDINDNDTGNSQTTTETIPTNPMQFEYYDD